MELWDIYDSDKKRTGRTMKRNDWNLKNGEYHLTVLGVIHRPDGRFLITRRVMTKAWAPGWWEVSGGAVQAGEDSKVAVVKRQVLMCPIALMAIVLHIAVTTQTKAIIILLMCTALNLILTRAI